MSLFDKMHSESIDGGTFSGTGHAGNSHTDRLAGSRQTLLNDCLSDNLMFGLGTFHKSHRLAQHGNISFKNTLGIFLCRVNLTIIFPDLSQIRIDTRRAGYAFIYIQP